MELNTEFAKLPQCFRSQSMGNDYKLITLYSYYAFNDADESNAEEMIVKPDINGNYSSCCGITLERSGKSRLDAIYFSDDISGSKLELLGAYYVSPESKFDDNFACKIVNNIKSILENVSNKIFSSDNVRAEKTLEKALTEFDGIDINVLIKVVTNCTPSKKDKLNFNRKIENLQFKAPFKRLKISATIVFGDEIETEILQNQEPFGYVEEDKLMLDEPGHYLNYGSDAIVCSIRASSLMDLWDRKKDRGLLAMNLRYHVGGKKVDDKIADSLQNRPDDFWYFNNGIIIVCEDFKVRGNVLKLNKFSIVNGGQTTRVIGTVMEEGDRDFCLLCKVVKNSGTTETDKQTFVSKVAEASNTQKPIKAKDIISNRPEQKELKSDLEGINIFCEVKRGEKPFPKAKYKEAWQKTKNEELAQDLYSFVFMKPGSAWNNVSKILEDDDIYRSIFIKYGKFDSGFIKSLLYLEKSYKNYRNYIQASSDADFDKVGLVASGLHFSLAIIGFFLKYTYCAKYVDQCNRCSYDTNDLSLYKQLGIPAFNHEFVDFEVPFADFSVKNSNLFDLIFNRFIVPTFKKAHASKNDLIYATWLKKNSSFMDVLKTAIQSLKLGEGLDARIASFFKNDFTAAVYRENDFFYENNLSISTGRLIEDRTPKEEPDSDKKLRGDLLLRYNLSKKFHKGEEFIFSDDQLMKIVRDKPTSKAALIKYVNRLYVAVAGEQILGLIEKYI